MLVQTWFWTLTSAKDFMDQCWFWMVSILLSCPWTRCMHPFLVTGVTSWTCIMVIFFFISLRFWSMSHERSFKSIKLGLSKTLPTLKYWYIRWVISFFLFSFLCLVNCCWALMIICFNKLSWFNIFLHCFCSDISMNLESTLWTSDSDGQTSAWGSFGE